MVIKAEQALFERFSELKSELFVENMIDTVL